MNHASMERDEVYVPKTRSILGLPSKQYEEEHGIDWDEYFGDTPIYTMFMLVRQQLLAFPAYLRESNNSCRPIIIDVVYLFSFQCFR